MRTYFCNLTCSWCDSKYTWINQDVSKAGVDYRPMTSSEVVERVMSYSCKHVVLTGGEPLMHQKLLIPVLAGLKKEGVSIEVETNGTLEPNPELVKLVECFNVSPKTSNSLVDVRLRTRRSALEAFVDSRKAWFKFVVSNPDDLVEVEELISANGLPRDRIMLMPEGTDSETLLERSRWLVGVCEEKGFRLSQRLHILLFGNRRGT